MTSSTGDSRKASPGPVPQRPGIIGTHQRQQVVEAVFNDSTKTIERLERHIAKLKALNDPRAKPTIEGLERAVEEIRRQLRAILDNST